MAYKITGVTRDNSGNLAGSVDVFLLKYNSGTHSFTQVAHVTSDASTAVYTFSGIVDNDPAYNVVAFKDGSPDMFDVSDRNLTPVTDTSAMNPAADLPGLFWWFDIQSFGSLHDGLSGGDRPTDGGDLGSATNVSPADVLGGTWAFTASGTGQVGKYFATGLNGLPSAKCVAGAGLTDWTYSNTTGTNTTTFTAAFVLRVDAAANQNLVAIVGADTFVEWDNTQSLGIYYVDATARFFVGGTGFSIYSANSSIVVGDVYTFILTCDGTNARAYVNGSLVSTPQAFSSALLVDNTYLRLGSMFTYGDLSDSSWGEGLMTTDALDAGEVASLHAYFANRWVLG